MHSTMEAPPSVTVRNAGDFAARMREVCAAGENVVLDCTALAEVDLSFLQIVHAARAALGVAGRTLVLAAPADAPVAALLKRAGFAGDAAAAQSWLEGTCLQ